MKIFNFHQTTEIRFGRGRIQELPALTSLYGKKVLLVTTPSPADSPLRGIFDQVKNLLISAGLQVCHYDEVPPNPTVSAITEGAKMAVAFGAEVVIGLGGGSSMDAAKAISVEATHEGTCWDYLFYKSPQPDPRKLLPVIAVSTTSGTGSQVTQVAVVTHTDTRDKSALYNNILYPNACIIDPELMVSKPRFVTACTGFDVLCHAFESILNPGSGAYVELLAWEAIGLAVEHLPIVLEEPDCMLSREKMAWADTLAGLCIANSGVTLPHGMGMAIGGMYPKVAHGEALAIVYPAFADFTWESAIPEFARLARRLNLELVNASEEMAASRCSGEIQIFLDKIGLSKRLRHVDMPEDEIEELAVQSMVLPDYKANPRVATREEMIELVKAVY